MSRRLLMGGSGSFVIPPSVPAFFTLTAAPHGSWTGPQEPKAITLGDNTYFGWINGSTGDQELAAYDALTQTTGSIFDLAALSSPDNHAAPATMVRLTDSRIMTGYCTHDGPSMYLRVSTNPDDASAFAAAVDLDGQFAGPDDYTYPTIVQLGGVSNILYFFFRDYSAGPGTGRLGYSTSTDGGTTWAVRRLLQTGAAGKVPYWRITTDWDTRIDIFTTDDAPNIASSLYHMWIDGSTGDINQTDGTFITSITGGGIPITTSSMTLVQSNAGGNVVCMGAGFDGAIPFCSLMIDTGSDNEVKQARWDGSAWQVDTVLASVGGIFGGNQFASGSATHHENPDIVYASRLISGQWELCRYVSPDGGATWPETQVTSASASANVWVDAVHRATSDFEAMWLYGSYTSDTNNNFGIRGLRLA